MTKKSSLIRNALVLTFVSSVGFSSASLAAPCTAQVDALQTVFNDQFCQNGKLCNRLSRKLDKVNAKLEKGKMRKAARKLGDFGSVVEMIAEDKKRKFYKAGNRFDRGTYEQMMGIYYNAALACISNPGAPAPDVPEVVDPNEEVY